MQHVYVTLMPKSFSGMRLCPISNSKALMYILALHGLSFLMISPSSWLVAIPQSPYVLQEMVFLQVGKLAELWPPTSAFCLEYLSMCLICTTVTGMITWNLPCLSLLVSLLVSLLICVVCWIFRYNFSRKVMVM